jgi:hypothetical protein
MVVFVCLVSKRCKERENKNQKEPGTTVVVVAVVKGGEEAQINE